MSCYVDARRQGKHNGEIYPTCCLDYNKPDECSYAKELVLLGKGAKTQCKFWVVAEPKRLKVKMDEAYGSILEGHWFYLTPADEHAEQALGKHLENLK